MVRWCSCKNCGLKMFEKLSNVCPSAQRNFITILRAHLSHPKQGGDF